MSSAGASEESVKVVDTTSGTVSQTIRYTAPEAVSVGVVWSPHGTQAFVSAGGNGKIRTYHFDGTTLTEGPSIPTGPSYQPPKGLSYPMGLAISKDGKTLYAAENHADSLAIIDLTTATVAHVSLGSWSEQGSSVNTSRPQTPAWFPHSRLDS